MKVLKSTLRRIILEEYCSVLEETKAALLREASLPWPFGGSPEPEPKPAQPKKRALEFEDLANLTGLAIQHVLRQVDRDDLVLALIDTDQGMRDLFLAQVSSRAADDIRKDMQQMTSSYVGPGKARAPIHIPDSRKRSAQRRIIVAAVKLAKDGSIVLPGDAELGADPDFEPKQKKKERPPAQPGYAYTKTGEQEKLPPGATRFAQWEGKMPSNRLFNDHLNKQYNK